MVKEKMHLDDSDIEIIENSNTIVTIAESEEEENLIESIDNVADVDDASEEGELVDKEEDANFVFEVKFQNDTFFQRNGTLICEALEKVLQNTTDSIKCNLSSTELRITAFCTSSNKTEENAKHSSKESSPDLTGIKELFTIDPSPSEIPEFVQVPSYKRSIKNVLDEESNDIKRKKTDDLCQRARPSMACFNCGISGHALRDCPKKRNGRRITKARNKFMTNADKRYHSNIEDRYPHLRPGTISEPLRKALSLRTGEIPFFYYRMRALGYPPGWLEEAKVQPSGLTLISADDNKVSLESDAKTDENVSRVKFDVSKLIDFPGFNAVPNRKFFDDYKHHNTPPMQPSHMKEEFIKLLGNNVIEGYKRKRLSNTQHTAGEKNANENLSPTDMEIDNEQNLEKPDNSCENLTEKCNASPPAKRVCSPTLSDLEAEQIAIEQALGSVNANADKNRKNSETDCASSTPNSGLTTPVIKESHMGTPLLKFSPFDKLPSGDNFKVGVSDVINFENLPDSTGKYEQMKLVIKKVRNIVTQLNNDTTD